MAFRWWFLASLRLAASAPIGCGNGSDDGGDADADADADADSDADTDADTDTETLEARCTDPTAPTCIDEMIVDLSLQDDLVTEGAVETTPDGSDFVTTVDATAGGFGQETTNPWVYVRFDANGATRVDIDDETALESMEWHMALRRFIVRLNGGTSGPSCVDAVSLLEGEYADVTEVPDGLDELFAEDAYYTEDCTFVNDSSGLPGSPQVALGAWWSYPGCISTTRFAHIVRLENGRILKLVVESYYEDPADQAECDENFAPPEGAVSAYYMLRWRFLQ